MTNKIKKFLHILVHLIPDGHDEIPIFALYHPLLVRALFGFHVSNKQVSAASWRRVGGDSLGVRGGGLFVGGNVRVRLQIVTGPNLVNNYILS